MKRHWRSKVFFGVSICSIFLFLSGSVSAQSLTFDKDIDLNNHAIINATSVSVGTGGIIFPGGLVQSAPFLGTSQTFGATNISAGVFGASASKGVYTFEAQGSTNPVLVIDGSAQRVGVGKTAPQFKLDVNDDNSTSSMGIKIGGTFSDALYIQRTFDADNGYVRMMLGGNLFWDPGTNLWNYGAAGSNGFGAVMAYGNNGLRFYTKSDSGNVAGTVSNQTLQSSYLRMAINEQGDVSIGTSTAPARLHISDTDPNDIIRMSNEDTNDYYSFRFDSSGNLFLDFRDYSAAANYYPLKIMNNARTDALVVSSSNVGIGTATPASKLTVAGTIETTSGGVKFPDGTTQTSAAASVVSARDVTAEVFGSNQGNGNFAFPGNLGIGYSSFNNLAHRIELATGTTPAGGIAFGDVELYRSGAQTLELGSGDSLNVNINGASPSSGAFKVGGSSVITNDGGIIGSAARMSGGPAFAFAEWPTTGITGLATGTPAQAKIFFIVDNAMKMSLDATGRLMVGGTNLSALNQLDIYGNVAIGTGYATGNGSAKFAPTNGLIVEGNVGIGTSTAPSKLSLGQHTTAAGGIMFGTDVELYRSNANVLSVASGDAFNIVSGALQVAGTEVINSNRYVRANAGTAATPSHSFAGDQNSGMYSGGADVLKFVTNGTDRITVDANGLVSGSAQPRVKAYLTSDYSINTGTEVTTSLQAEVFDTGSMHDNVTNPSRVTIPAGGSGAYMINAQAYFTVASRSGIRHMKIVKNGSQIIAQASDNHDAINMSTGDYILNATVVDEAVAGDYYELVTRFAGGSFSINVLNGSSSTFISAAKLW